MIRRLQKLNTSQSLFLFGARGTGKSTLVSSMLKDKSTVLWIDLLREQDERRYRKKPSALTEELATGNYRSVVIDEIQKNIKLLDIVHLEIEKKKGIQFFLTGSSARKLKRGGANLLAGRAFTFFLFPLTHIELGPEFELQRALQYGTLPQLSEYSETTDVERYLKSYVKTYLREEIIAEQMVRKIEPFQDFLEIAAQMNGKIINYSKIAADIGVDDKTIKTYYDILSETLVGYFLPPFHRSIRKRQRESPKFYLFDTGVSRVLSSRVSLQLDASTFEYGNAFEHFVMCEFMRLNSYFECDYKFSYLRTKDDAEVDLIVERPGLPDLLIEMKSYESVDDSDATKLRAFLASWDKPAEAMLLSRDPREALINNVLCIDWMRGIKKIFTFDVSAAV